MCYVLEKDAIYTIMEISLYYIIKAKNKCKKAYKRAGKKGIAMT